MLNQKLFCMWIGSLFALWLGSACVSLDGKKSERHTSVQPQAGQKPDAPVVVKTPDVSVVSPAPQAAAATQKVDDFEPGGPNHSFRSGAVWLDTNGTPINAHGGGLFYENGVYYWFGEHKAKDGDAHTGIHVYASKDLYNWHDRSIALEVDKQHAQSDIAEGCIMERPKVIFNAKTKKYVMWFHLELKGQGYGAARAGVAVSDKVIGPYTFHHSFRPNDAMSRDQTLFVDEDGTAYQFTASEDNQTMHINQLTDDYLRPNGTMRRIFVGRSSEAPAVFKYQGRYHLIASGCTGWDPNSARQAVADSVLGEWTELDNPAQGSKAYTTFDSQSTYVLEVQSQPGHFIYVGDRWNSQNLEDSRYIWLPLTMKGQRAEINWVDEWDLSRFRAAP